MAEDSETRVHVSLTLPPEMAQYLRDEARQQGLPVTRMGEVAIRTYRTFRERLVELEESRVPQEVEP